LVSPFFPVLHTKLGTLTLGVPITRESVSEVPFAEEPALGFSFAEKLEDLTPAFREPALHGESSAMRGNCSGGFSSVGTNPEGS